MTMASTGGEIDELDLADIDSFGALGGDLAVEPLAHLRVRVHVGDDHPQPVGVRSRPL